MMKRGRRTLAARYLRALAHVEHLIEIGSYERARVALAAAIDPLEARSLAAELERDIEPESGSGKRPAPARRLPGLDAGVALALRRTRAW